MRKVSQQGILNGSVEHSVRDGIDVDRFFRSLDAQNVPFCVVGDAERPPRRSTAISMASAT